MSYIYRDINGVDKAPNKSYNDIGNLYNTVQSKNRSSPESLFPFSDISLMSNEIMIHQNLDLIKNSNMCYPLKENGSISQISSLNECFNNYPEMTDLTDNNIYHSESNNVIGSLNTFNQDRILHQNINDYKTITADHTNKTKNLNDLKSTPVACEKVKQNENIETEMKKKKHSRKAFTPEEDAMITSLVKIHGIQSWELIASLMGRRTARQCRERWRSFLSPDLTNLPWTREEDTLLIRLHAEHGPKWALIAKYFIGRSDYNVKNRWQRFMRYCELYKANDRDTNELLKIQFKKDKKSENNKPLNMHDETFDLSIGWSEIENEIPYIEPQDLTWDV